MSMDTLLWIIVAAQASVALVCMPMNVRLKRIGNQRKAEMKVTVNGIVGQVWFALFAALVITVAWIWLFAVTDYWQFLFIGAIPFLSQRITDAAAKS